ncbi:class I SAM-dependent methyltransferase [Mycobacterium vicinigordonae]|uniref:class I SAM-dependent methyltransferase n=1 Tax=Mycobacterium vicinigordonae TaxID=1719132 RepID=UPI001FE89DF1|nr:class I SAM-dependent methyltransferase [Mycobacterium vicinigordonae]
MSTRQPWNINIHYNALVDAEVPPSTQRVLDVGCGDGFLAARLVQRIPQVAALDIDGGVLQRAQTRFAGAPIHWMQGDVMTVELPTFDAVVSNAAFHHIDDTKAALARLCALVSPGGTLAVVTFVRVSLRELWWHLPSWIACTMVNRVRGKWDHTAPIKWPPPDTFSQLRSNVRTVLPEARVRRLLYGRVLITWRAPV